MPPEKVEMSSCASVVAPPMRMASTEPESAPALLTPPVKVAPVTWMPVRPPLIVLVLSSVMPPASTPLSTIAPLIVLLVPEMPLTTITPALETLPENDVLLTCMPEVTFLGYLV